ncbi:MAG: 50S ribosomal protein L32 [Candidatus Saccharibacteria bacterium]
MGKPKKRTSPRRTGTRRSHLVLKLARAVNGKSPIKAFTTRKESGKTLSAKINASNKVQKV